MYSARTLLLLVISASLLSGENALAQDKSRTRREPSFGLIVAKHSTGCWEIDDVSLASKAAACHFRPRDLVCAVNGHHAGSFSSSEIAALPQTTKCGSLTVKKHSCARLIHGKKGARPQDLEGKLMGVGLHLQSLKNGEVSTGYYVISGVDPGMAAHNSRKIHAGDWLESIDKQSVAKMQDLSVVKYKLEGLFGKAVEVCFWSPDATAIELQQLQTAASDFPYAAFAIGAILLLLSIVYLKWQSRPKPPPEDQPSRVIQESQLPPLLDGDAINWPRQLTESHITDLSSRDWSNRRSAQNKIIAQCEGISKNYENYEALSRIQHELIFEKYHHHLAIQLKQCFENRDYEELLNLLNLISALQLHLNIRHHDELMQFRWLLASMHMAEANQEILIAIATSKISSEDVQLEAIITFSKLARCNWKMQLEAMKKGLFDVLLKLSRDHKYLEKIIPALANLVQRNFRLQKWLHENFDLFPSVWNILDSSTKKVPFKDYIKNFEFQLDHSHTRDNGDYPRLDDRHHDRQHCEEAHGSDEFAGHTVTLVGRKQVGGTCYAYACARSFIHSMRNCGILPSMSPEDEQERKKNIQINELEFKKVLRWIVCGETQATPAKLDLESWPGGSFCGGLLDPVFRALLEEYAPMNWPTHKDWIKGMKVESCPRGLPAPHRYHHLMQSGVVEAIDSGEEPVLGLYARLLNSEYGSIEEAPFRPNHAVCISRYDAASHHVFIKDSNFEDGYPFSTLELDITGFREFNRRTQTWRYAEGCGPSLMWIRSKPSIQTQKQQEQHLQHKWKQHPKQQPPSQQQQ